jgi:D-inositol-3-phosphate glycosyltransferase
VSKRIAFLITSTGWGGLEMNTLKLASHLRQRGYHITLLSQEGSSIRKQGSAAFDAVVLLNKPRKYFDFRSARSIGKALRSGGINTLVAFDSKNLDLVAWTKRLFHKQLKVLYQQHNQIGIDKKDPLHTMRFRAIDRWVTPLNWLKQEIIQRTKYPAERIRVVPLGVDVAKLALQRYTKTEARAALGLTPQAPLLGIIGRISEKKGQRFLVDSVAKLKDQGTRVELLIFGSATINDTESQQYERELLQAVKDHGLNEVVHFVPHRDDVSVFYNAVDVFVLASHSETYGMVTIEAMLAGLPIIATRTGGTSELLGEGSFGSLYDYEDFDGFATCLSSVFDNPERHAAMAREAQRKAHSTYTLQVELDGIDVLLQELDRG